MTATTSRGVKCGNCGTYHPSAGEVRACYTGARYDDHVGQPDAVVENHSRHCSTCLRDPRFCTCEKSQWGGSNTKSSPFGNGPSASPKQLSYISDLVEKREFPFGDLEDHSNSHVRKLALDVRNGETIRASEVGEVLKWLKSLPFKNGKTQTARLPNMPAGHYAVSSLTGNNDLDFFRVDRPTDGRHKGKTFIKRVIGGHPDTPIRWAEYPKVLQAILDAGVEEAAKRYGQQVGRCYRCNRHLTDETSRALGIGPDCRSREA